VLLEADLWPTVAAARAAGIPPDGGPARASLGRGPVPLFALLRWIGGGHDRFEAACAAWVEAVQRCCHVAPWSPVGGRRGLEAWLEPLLDRLGPPLPDAVSAALWGVAARPLPRPEEGELACWRVSSAALAVRLGQELSRRIASDGSGSWCLVAGIEEDDTVPRPAVEATGVLVTAGVVQDADMAAAQRWAAQPGCASVVVGVLPPGWEEAPGVPPAARPGGLVTAGGDPRDTASVAVRLGLGKELLPAAVARGVAGAARQRWRIVEASAAGTAEPVLDLLRLDRDGLPEAYLLPAAGRGRDVLERLAAEGVIVRFRERWRLTTPAPMEPDPRHRDVAALYAPDDPRATLHRALAGESGPLRDWLADRLGSLCGQEIQSLLGGVRPGALGREVALLHAQGCLLEADAAGARRALGEEQGGGAEQVLLWLRAIDGDLPDQPEEDGMDEAPLAAAMAALVAWQRSVRTGRAPGPWVAMAVRASGVLEGTARCLAGLRQLAIEAPERFRGREGRELAGENSYLRMEWLHQVAFLERARGRYRAARRALAALASAPSAMGPGRFGLVLLDLGCIELLLERRAAAARAHLAALRRLEASGLPGRAAVAAFDLGVADLDELRLERVGERLDALDPEERDPFAVAERARLALARGQLEECARLREAVDPPEATAGLREAVRFLDGALALLDGRLEEARRHLEEGGSEGRGWLELADAVSGQTGSRSRGPDGWGVCLAAALVRSARSGRVDVSLLREAGRVRREALGLALAGRLLPPAIRFDPAVTAAARGTLEAAGMDGWTSVLAARLGAGVGAFEALAWIGENGTFEGIPEPLGRQLLAVLGATGVEVRFPGGTIRLGEGAAGSKAELGGLTLVSLGGGTPEGPVWRLLGQLLAGSVMASAGITGAGKGDPTGLVGSSEAMEAVRRDLLELGPTRLPVLVHGETGTGKELAARALHRISGRSGRFVPVNVAAVPENLLESELFGSAKGAFTGAEARRGLVAAADGGTLFLDEIGELDPRFQAKLLRFLETGEVRPVGSTRARRIDVRVVSATHRDLEQMMAEGRFRRDLYYRLATVTVRIPPLRDRLEDLSELVETLAARLIAGGEVLPARWSAAALGRLRNHPWEGNVRELAHTVAVAMTRARGGVVRPEHLPLPPATERIGPRRWEDAVNTLRRQLIVEALERAGGNRSAAARELGISRQTLLYHMDRLGIA